MREPVGLRPDTEEKHTLNLSLNINPWLTHGMGALGHLAPLPSCAYAGGPATLGRSTLPCFAAESARAGTLMSLSEGAALGHNFSSPVRRSQQKIEKATAPSPSSSLYRYRAPSPHLLNRGRVFYLRGGGMVSSVVTSGTRSGASVFSGSALRVPEAKRGRVPCDGAEEIYGAPPPEQTQVS